MATNDFQLGRYPSSSLLIIYADKDEIQLAPEYQRIGGIWTPEKRQLLLDSLINGFDVPKLYFHEFVPPKVIKKKTYRYAIIDGKQRLEAIWDFIDGKLPLAEDFKYRQDPTVDAAGFGYAELASKYPRVKALFDARLLEIVTIRTDDLELIEDMFSRLNEAVPLNAPEKRGALGGPLPAAINKIADHDFFKKRVPFPDGRYRHRDLAAKFLYLEFEGKLVGTKKVDLDTFVRNFKKWRMANEKRANPVAVSKLIANVRRVLDSMTSLFRQSDSLLKQVGMITLYYHLFRLVRDGKIKNITRDMLVKFEDARKRNDEAAERGEEDVNQDLLEFDTHSQTPNDAYAIKIRLKIILRFLKSTFKHFDYEPATLEFDD